ncbi:MAG: mandelate racemase/muconate lactonizing enzyme family protein [Clostridiaceae bacterium]|nr:mandelate racemase/muconate lactonizing enzyme family protein [Eubacteriales bacterium]
MKITSIEVLLINADLGLTGKDGLKRYWRPIIVKVNTDEGIYGLGEVALAYGRAFNAGAGMVKDLAPMVIGLDPFDTEAIWNRMMMCTFWGQGGGIYFAGMSGIDMALWDIKGKALGVPVYKLLGGKCRDELRCYASQIQFGWGEKYKGLTETQQYADAARAAIEDGYDAVKVDLMEFDPQGNMKLLPLRGHIRNKDMDMAIERLAAIREAIGPDADIIIENHGETDVTTAIQMSREMKPFNIMFYEEVNTPMNAKLTRMVKEHCELPLAGGERIYGRYHYIPFLEERSLDVIQPDVGTCGGLTEAKKICDMAHAYEITVQTHICGSPIVKAASIHLEAALPNFIIHEHHRFSLMEGNVELCTQNYQPVNGKYRLPELPGLGQDLTPKAYAQADRFVITGD